MEACGWTVLLKAFSPLLDTGLRRLGPVLCGGDEGISVSNTLLLLNGCHSLGELKIFLPEDARDYDRHAFESIGGGIAFQKVAGSKWLTRQVGERQERFGIIAGVKVDRCGPRSGDPHRVSADCR